MKSSKLRLTVAAATILLAAIILSTATASAEGQDAQENLVVSDANLPQARPPVLTIGGKEDDRVYLQSLDIQVEVTGNIASTRYTMIFKNRTDRVLEGELTFPLPDGITVTHYALDINGKMRDAVPVDKAKATQVFEEIQRREVDPGILERVEGNNFRTRIYPIPANGIRTISIGYEEELPLEKNLLYYRLPMAYQNPIEKFAVKATVWKSSLKPLVPKSEDEIRFDRAGENYVAAFTRENYKPARALIFALPAVADIPQVMMQSAQGSFYFLASVAPRMETRKKQWSDDLAIIWDVSLSGSQRDLKPEMDMLSVIFSEKKNANVHLYFLNNRLNKIINKNTANGEYKVANGNWNELMSVLLKAIFDGGTDFSQINLDNITGDEILFFSDGISTLSDADFLKNATDKRPIHCIVSSAKADYSMMRLIAGKTKGKFININALSQEKLKNEVLNETLQFLGTEHGNTIREVYPGIAMPVHGNFSVAGISGSSSTELTLLFGFGNKVERRVKVKLDAQKATRQGNVYKIWAQKKIADLDLSYEKNRAELTELGQQFGIVTRNTSLMVLEEINDYVRYDIEPPASEPQLRAEYLRRLKERADRRRETERNMLKEAVAAADTLKKWWATDFTPKPPKYPTPDSASARREGVSGIGYGVGYGSGFGGSAGGIGDIMGGMMGGAGGQVHLQRRGSLRVDAPEFLIGGVKSEESASQPTITIKPIKKDNEYLSKLTGKTANDYQLYLKLRNDYANSPTFYFDMADWFYKHNDRETALRVLTSIAELELENASLYRLLGYRFKEYGEHTLQKFVCMKVVQWRPMDPQSYRDYALALADNGEAQAALDSLYGVLTRLFPADNIRHSHGIEETIVTEINRLIAKHPRLNTSKIDKRLLINIPVDIRVVINWNMNDVDIDLHVKDPNKEECHYGSRLTKIGGRISADITSGFGPEQFMLKKAVRGKYQIYVNYFGNREFTKDGPSTIMAEIFTRYADKSEQRQVVCLQMSNVKKGEKDDKKVEIAEFEF